MTDPETAPLRTGEGAADVEPPPCWVLRCSCIAIDVLGALACGLYLVAMGFNTVLAANLAADGNGATRGWGAGMWFLLITGWVVQAFNAADFKRRFGVKRGDAMHAWPGWARFVFVGLMTPVIPVVSWARATYDATVGNDDELTKKGRRKLSNYMLL